MVKYLNIHADEAEMNKNIIKQLCYIIGMLVILADAGLHIFNNDSIYMLVPDIIAIIAITVML